MLTHDILIVDDEADIRNLITDLLQEANYKTRGVEDGPAALEAVNICKPDLVLLDIWLGDRNFDGMKLLEIMQRDNMRVPVVIMSAQGNTELAASAIKQGACNFIGKPFKSSELLMIIAQAIKH